MMNQGMGISVMPETIFYIGGEVMGLIKKDYDLARAEDLSFQFMIYLKENLLVITKNISDMYAQASMHMNIQVAHDLAVEHLYELAKEVLNLRPKKTMWETYKESDALTPVETMVLKAIEVANSDELYLLEVVYPDFVAAYKEFAITQTV